MTSRRIEASLAQPRRDPEAVRTMRSLVGLALAITMVSGCGVLEPGGMFPPAPADLPAQLGEIEKPPLASINGVEGGLGSFCWQGGCADMFMHPPDSTGMPHVTPPLRVAFPLPVEDVGAMAISPGGSYAQTWQLEMTDGAIEEPFPVGAVMVMVSVLFRDGGSASYYWGVDDLIGRPTPTPTPAP